MDQQHSEKNIVQRKWNASSRDKYENRPLRFAWQNPTVSRFINNHYLDGSYGVMYVLKNYMEERIINKALELGGGIGDTALQLHDLCDIREFTVIEISDYCVEIGNKRSAEHNLNIQFIQGDLNYLELPSDTYDLIVANGSLHHINRLEHLFSQVNSALSDSGVFFANDYMGPSYMQWTKVQLHIMNSILSCFPDRYATTSHRNNEICKTIKPIPIEIFQKYDPSEGVRAAEIFKVMSTHLNVERVIPICHSILYELLRGRIHNFDDDDLQDRFVLELMCMFEKILYDYAVVDSDFNLVIAERKLH
ncbi:MAG: class I SAM-dependent methyltransferase [Deltaproteobacteria bacterium]|nr:class I SAM-dependent methyltransferase [Deltaproteobacteria bacterium]